MRVDDLDLTTATVWQDVRRRLIVERAMQKMMSHSSDERSPAKDWLDATDEIDEEWSRLR